MRSPASPLSITPGRISASALDSFGETFGSVSSLQITNWTGSGGTYSGTFNILPDRGYNNNNSGGFFSDYAARIQQMAFSFTPSTGVSEKPLTFLRSAPPPTLGSETFIPMYSAGCLARRSALHSAPLRSK